MCSTSAVSHDDKRMDGVKCPICPQPRLSNQLTYQTWRWQQNFLRNVAPPPALKLYLGRYLLMFLMSSSRNKYWRGRRDPATHSQCYQVSSQVNHVLEINMLHSYSYFHGSLVRWTLNIWHWWFTSLPFYQKVPDLELDITLINWHFHTQDTLLFFNLSYHYHYILVDVYCVSKHQLLTWPCITAARADDWLLVSPLAPGAGT